MFNQTRYLVDTSAYMWHTIRNRSGLRTETSALGWSPTAPSIKSFPERNVFRKFSQHFLQGLQLPQEVLIANLLVTARLCDDVEASRLIHSGAVAVDGQVISSQTRYINPAECSVSIAGRPLEDCVTISYAINKPPRYTCTSRDALKRPSVFTFLPNPNWYYHPIDIVDFSCSGLVILSSSRISRDLEQTWEIDLNGKTVRDWEVESWPFESERVDESIFRVKTRISHLPRLVYTSINKSIKLTRTSLGDYSLDSLGITTLGSSSLLYNLDI